MMFGKLLFLVVIRCTIGLADFEPMLYENSLQVDGNTGEIPNPLFWNVLGLESDSEGGVPEEAPDNGIQKRPNVKLIPRIGRKKRSLSDAGQPKEWDYFVSADKPLNKVVFIPGNGGVEQKRAVFIPRIGRGAGHNRISHRAVFIPRIG